jgi:hypothetical protein
MHTFVLSRFAVAAKSRFVSPEPETDYTTFERILTLFPSLLLLLLQVTQNFAHPHSFAKVSAALHDANPSAARKWKRNIAKRTAATAAATSTAKPVATTATALATATASA